MTKKVHDSAAKPRLATPCSASDRNPAFLSNLNALCPSSNSRGQSDPCSMDVSPARYGSRPNVEVQRRDVEHHLDTHLDPLFHHSFGVHSNCWAPERVVRI